ncbi:MAG: ECF-type sigma factor [Steroidobacteraceae bacterium]|jgi:RNA polymerase sigma factor (TIGR02999 family)
MAGTHEHDIAIDGDLGAPAETQRMAAALIPLMYQDLRRIARRERLRVRAGATLQTTALVHEAYLKLEHLASFNDDEHFLRACALAMRHILVNHARERMARKRGGGAANIPIDEAPEIGSAPDEVVVKINDALLELAQLSPRLAQVVECRFFAGYDDAETALALGLTDRTVRRDWVKARAWLRRELGTGVDGALADD